MLLFLQVWQDCGGWQGSLDDNQDGAKDFRFYGLPNYGGVGNMLHCYTAMLPANIFIF